MTTLAKYVTAVLLWAIFYLIVSFAVAIGFGLGWRLVTGNSLQDSISAARKGTGSNGDRPNPTSDTGSASANGIASTGTSG